MVQLLVSAGFNVLLFALVVYLLITGASERKELYNRIMSGTLENYSNNTSNALPPSGRNPIKRNIELAHAKYLEGKENVGSNQK